jgi:RNA polymerase sigma-70 factor (ECF subfamily)
METLLDRLRRRNPAAFQEALVRYGPPLQRALERLLRDRSAAEDVAQDSFARLFVGIDSVRSLRAWLFQVALNLARTHLRRGRLRARLDACTPRHEASPDLELRELIENAVDDLPEGSRVAFVLYEIGGLSTAEIAETERCSIAAVRQRLVDARRRLRAALAPHVDQEV